MWQRTKYLRKLVPEIMASIKAIRKDFPVLANNPSLVYLDSTATSLKPQTVIDAERKYYEQVGATVHRGVYDLSQKATDMYEGVRETVRKFINAKSTKEIIFTRNATEAINLVASSLAHQLVSGDVVLLSEMEHHSNIVPWQMLKERGGEIKFVPLKKALRQPPPAPPLLRRGIDDATLDFSDELDMAAFDQMLNKKVKIVAITQMSNVLGTVNDVKTIIERAHKAGALVLVDAAQSVPHMPVDVQDLDADFLVFSGHKMLGPTGTGVLYGKAAILQEMPPFMRGGDMVLEVTKDGAKWNELPWKFEAGTPNISGFIGLGAAIEYLQKLGMENVWAHDQELSKYGLEQLGKIEGVNVLGSTTPQPLLAEGGGRDATTFGRAAIFAMDISGVHPHDIGSILNSQNIAIRAGHHCAMPLHQHFGIPATARASGYVYTTKEDIDALVKGILKAKEIFQ